MDLAARFEALVRGPEPATRLDELALIVAARADSSVDLPAAMGALDDIAARCADASFDGVLAHLRAERFDANRVDY
ncbi:MAG TPA: hypothetical protein VGZ52_09535, partial [Acidimicrobiales bacterium]|nr:hypothetical protein [Acidimicrobiales bacterium]